MRKGVCGEKGNDAPAPEPLSMDLSTRVLCCLLIVGILWLGVYPAPLMNAISASLASINLPLPL